MTAGAHSLKTLARNGIPPSSQKDNEFERRKMRERLEYL
jgi:hypothetical protein